MAGLVKPQCGTGDRDECLLGAANRRPKTLSFNGFRDSQCIIELGAEISGCAIHLGVTRQ